MILDTYVTHYLVHDWSIQMIVYLHVVIRRQLLQILVSPVGSAVTCLHVGSLMACILNVLIVHPTFIYLVNLKVAPKFWYS